MDNTFDIYDAKVDNDKVTEWDQNLLYIKSVIHFIWALFR